MLFWLICLTVEFSFEKISIDNKKFSYPNEVESPNRMLDIVSIWTHMDYCITSHSVKK